MKDERIELEDDQIEILRTYYIKIVEAVTRMSINKEHEFGNLCVFLYKVTTTSAGAFFFSNMNKWDIFHVSYKNIFNQFGCRFMTKWQIGLNWNLKI